VEDRLGIFELRCYWNW